jgi:serine protease Do
MPIAGFGEVAEKLRRSTVLIRSGGHSSGGSGSGVIWTSDGLIVTNAHVARGPHVRLQLWDGREFDATISSRDPRRDLAALRINASGLPAAEPADSSQAKPGELAIAIGNPLGFIGALTMGIVQAVGPIRGLGPHTWIQASVRLAPGNSGGPLADATGRVIGINTMVAGRVGLAIPASAVTRFLATGPGDGWLGVTVQPVRVPRAPGHAFGLLVLEIEPGSPAAYGSLLPGDILLGTEEKQFRSLEDVASELQAIGPRLLRLEFLRGDYTHVRRVTIQLGNPSQARSAAAA